MSGLCGAIEGDPCIGWLVLGVSFLRDYGSEISVLWKKGIGSSIFRVDHGEVEAIGVGECFSVYARPSKNKNLFVFYVARKCECLFERERNNASVNSGGVSRDDNISAVGEGAANRFVRFSPHDDRVSGGECFHSCKVGSDAPDESILFPEFAISSNGSDAANTWCLHRYG